MTHRSLEDAEVRAAMAAYVAAADALDAASEVGGEARELLDLAEAKSVAALRVRQRLTALGWSAPAAQRTTT